MSALDALGVADEALALYLAGATHGDLARRYGVSRNTCIGHAHRRGWPARPSPIVGATITDPEAARDRYNEARRAKRAATRAARIAAWLERRAAQAAARAAKPPSPNLRAAAVARHTAGRCALTRPATKRAGSKPAAAPAAPASAPRAAVAGVSLSARPSRLVCAWPDPVCDAPRDGKRPYCTDHCAVAFVPTRAVANVRLSAMGYAPTSADLAKRTSTHRAQGWGRFPDAGP